MKCECTRRSHVLWAYGIVAVLLRLLGKLVISLQHVVASGRLLLREPLIDSNYSLTDVSHHGNTVVSE